MSHGKSDYGKIRERHQRAKEGDKRFWRPEAPKPGKKDRYKIRILPPPENMDSFFFEYGMHYRLGEDASGNQIRAACPRLTLGKACPICEDVKALWSAGGEENEALARRIGGKTRYASNIILLDDPEEVLVWSYGRKVWDQLMELTVGDEDAVIPIDDPKSGVDLTVTIGAEKTSNGTFPTYMVKTNPNGASKLDDMDVLDDLHNLESVIEQVKTYDELKAILTGEEVPNSPTTEEKEETAAPETEPDPKTEEETQTNEPKSKARSLADKARAAIRRGR